MIAPLLPRHLGNIGVQSFLGLAAAYVQQTEADDHKKAERSLHPSSITPRLLFVRVAALLDTGGEKRALLGSIAFFHAG